MLVYIHEKKSTLQGSHGVGQSRSNMVKKMDKHRAGRNINNLRYADDTTLMAESEEELKSLLMKVKEESEKVCLKLNIHKTKIMTSGPITSQQNNGNSDRLYFVGLQSHCRW